MPLTHTTRAFCKHNSSAQALCDNTEPWLNTEPIPEFETKAKYRAWCANPNTEHLFFSMVEGEVASLPIGNGNKPRRIHGVIADYDCDLGSDEALTEGIKRCNPQYPPRAWNRTRSGGARVVWLFEEPVFYYNQRTYRRFIARLKRELRIGSLFPALDDHIESTNIYYCAGAGWSVCDGGVVNAKALHLWLSECSRSDEVDEGLEIPLEIVAKEVEKRFPNRWEGDFKEGARGVRFWDPAADALSAIVRKTGMQAFTGDEPFLSWERIFGREFVQQYLEDRLGAALRDLFSDGNGFYRQLADDTWQRMDVSTARRHLVVHYGLSPQVPRGEIESEVDRALHRIETTKCVAGALPFPHNPDRLVTFNRRPYLNTSSARLWPAALDPQEWGDNFPWIASYLSTLFDNERGLQVFLSWLHVWIKSLYEREPRKGHALFIVGPPGTGKTFLTRCVLSRIVGGACEATQFLVDGNRYNDTLFEHCLWSIDDALPAADGKAHARFSALVKAVVANSTFRYEKKYGWAGDAPFDGRLCCTLNDDPRSLSLIPDIDQSLLDKIILVRTGDTVPDMAYDPRERYEILERELGAFVRWVLDYEIPGWIEREPRLGFRAYHDEGILADAQAVTTSSSVIEMVDLWRRRFAETHEGEVEWKGTTSELYGLLRNCAETSAIVAHVNPVWLGRHVSQAIANGTGWIGRGRRGDDKARVISIKLK